MEEMLWCGRRLSELSRTELEQALMQCYAMYMDANTPEAMVARAKAQVQKKIEVWRNLR